MKFSLQIRIKSAEGALERILRVVRFRGHLIDGVTANRIDHDRLDVRLALDGERSQANLISQLRKLFEVESVSYHSVQRVEAMMVTEGTLA